MICNVISTVIMLFSLVGRVEACKGTLKQLSEIASEADDLRAQALYDCCQFDALLELGEPFTRTLTGPSREVAIQ